MKRIVVVDDEPSITDAVKRAFRFEKGYEVVAANDGRDAMELIRGKHPDLILLDWRLKGEIQGKDILIFVKREYPDIPVYVVTASINFLKEIQSLGADGHILKPCTSTELKGRVKAALPPG